MTTTALSPSDSVSIVRAAPTSWRSTAGFRYVRGPHVERREGEFRNTYGGRQADFHLLRPSRMLCERRAVAKRPSRVWEMAMSPCLINTAACFHSADAQISDGREGVRRRLSLNVKLPISRRWSLPR